MTDVVRVKIEGRWYTVEVGDLSERPVRVVVDGFAAEVDVGGAAEDALAPAAVVARPARGAPPAAVRAPAPIPQTPSARPAGAVASASANPNKLFSAPMPGIILEINVKAGDQVVTGDAICVLEAMKMRQTLRADWSGVVKSVLAAVGQQVMGGDPIVELE